MPSTVNYFNHTAKLLLNGDIQSTPGTFHTLRVLLLSDAATFNAAHTAIAQVSNNGAYEVYGSGVSAGGVALSNVSVVHPQGTNDAYIDADDIDVAISGGDLGPFCQYVIYDSIAAGRYPLLYVAIKDGSGVLAPQTVLDGNSLNIIWAATGLMKLDAPAPV